MGKEQGITRQEILKDAENTTIRVVNYDRQGIKSIINYDHQGRIVSTVDCTRDDLDRLVGVFKVDFSTGLSHSSYTQISYFKAGDRDAAFSITYDLDSNLQQLQPARVASIYVSDPGDRQQAQTGLMELTIGRPYGREVNAPVDELQAHGATKYYCEIRSGRMIPNQHAEGLHIDHSGSVFIRPGQMERPTFQLIRDYLQGVNLSTQPDMPFMAPGSPVTIFAASQPVAV
jgi:hypothetical protein